MVIQVHKYRKYMVWVTRDYEYIWVYCRMAVVNCACGVVGYISQTDISSPRA